MWEAAEIRAMLKQAEPKPHLRAMILLGISFSEGNARCPWHREKCRGSRYAVHS
jgi:hypothetical protein